MVGYPSPRREWSLNRKLDAIRDAGFDGVAAYITPEIKAGADARGLKLMSGFDCGSLKIAEQRLKNQRDLGVHFMNVQLLDHDTPPAKAAAMAVKLIALSDELGVGVHIETHRDTATETPEKYTEIARLFRKATGRLMPTTWDHSHLAVSKHVQPKDYSTRLLAWPKLIQHSHMFHLRPFNGQHCQVPVTNGRGRLTPEFIDYLAFVEDLFVLWLQGPAAPRRTLGLPEMGMSHGYNVSTNPPVWPDVVRCRRELLAAWARARRRAG
jgi:sugar phosphate isomerase/epimerase